MRAYQATYPVVTMANVLGVSTSGYYAWRDRGPSERAQEDERLLALIVKYHERSSGNYGAPRIHQDLVQEAGVTVGLKRGNMRGSGRPWSAKEETHLRFLVTDIMK